MITVEMEETHEAHDGREKTAEELRRKSTRRYISNTCIVWSKERVARIKLVHVGL